MTGKDIIIFVLLLCLLGSSGTIIYLQYFKSKDVTPDCSKCPARCDTCDFTPDCDTCDFTPDCDTCDFTPDCDNACDACKACDTRCDGCQPDCDTCDFTPDCDTCDFTPDCDTCDFTPDCDDACDACDKCDTRCDDCPCNACEECDNCSTRCDDCCDTPCDACKDCESKCDQCNCDSCCYKPSKVLWMRHATSPENDYTYPQAESYCAEKGGRLATYAELIDAYKKGYNMCYKGWLDRTFFGNVLQKENDATCGSGINNVGFNGAINPTPPTTKGGIYCVASNLPSDNPDIYDHIVLEYNHAAAPDAAPSHKQYLWNRSTTPGFNAEDYNLNFADSQKYCIERGGRLASQEDLMKAYRNGYEYCNIGWLADGSAGYAMHQPNKYSCFGGDYVEGVNILSPNPPSSTNLGCYCVGPNVPAGETNVGPSILIDKPAKKSFWMSGNYVTGGRNFMTSHMYCATNNGKLATNNEFAEANKKGFTTCYSGWLHRNGDVNAAGLGFATDRDKDPTCTTLVNKPNVGTSIYYNVPIDNIAASYCVGEKVPNTPDVQDSVVLEYT